MQADLVMVPCGVQLYMAACNVFLTRIKLIKLKILHCLHVQRGGSRFGPSYSIS